MNERSNLLPKLPKCSHVSRDVSPDIQMGGLWECVRIVIVCCKIGLSLAQEPSTKFVSPFHPCQLCFPCVQVRATCHVHHGILPCFTHERIAFLPKLSSLLCVSPPDSLQSSALLYGWIKVGWSLRVDILSGPTHAAQHNAAVVHRVISAGASGNCSTAICSV